MLAILLATTLSGALFSKVLLMCNIADFRMRYPLSVLASYLVFFFCIKLWLFCISPNKSKKTIALNGLDFPSPSGRGSGGGGVPLFRAGGGQFSGAGASGSLEGHDAAIVETGILSETQPTPVSGSSGGVGHAIGDGLGALGDDDITVAVIVLAVLVATIFFSAVYVLYNAPAILSEAQPAPVSGGSSGVGDIVGDGLGALGDDDITVAVIVLAVLVATIFLSAVYVLYNAPAILSEAAFQGFLAASLIRRTRAMSDHSWLGSVFKMTWVPFAVTIAVAFVCGVVLHRYFPEAAKLTDILWKR